MRSAQWRSLNTVSRYSLQSEEDKRKTNRMLTSTEIIKCNPESKPEEPEGTPKSSPAIRKVQQSTDNLVSLGYSHATFTNCSNHYSEGNESEKPRKRAKKNNFSNSEVQVASWVLV